MGCSKSSSKREFIAIQSYKKQEKHQIDNLITPRTTGKKNNNKKKQN